MEEQNGMLAHGTKHDPSKIHTTGTAAVPKNARNKRDRGATGDRRGRSRSWKPTVVRAYCPSQYQPRPPVDVDSLLLCTVFLFRQSCDVKLYRIIPQSKNNRSQMVQHGGGTPSAFIGLPFP